MPKPDVAAARAAAHQQIIALKVVPLEGGAGHLYQVEQDYQHGMREAWSNWSPEAKWFVAHFRGLEPLRPPRLTDKLAEELASSIGALYRAAYPSCSPFSPELVLIIGVGRQRGPRDCLCASPSISLISCRRMDSAND